MRKLIQKTNERASLLERIARQYDRDASKMIPQDDEAVMSDEALYRHRLAMASWYHNEARRIRFHAHRFPEITLFR